VRNKEKNKNTSPCLLLPRLNFSPSFLTLLLPLSPQVCQGGRNGGLQSVHNTISAAPSSSHFFPTPVWILSMGYSPSRADCSCMGCSPWTTVPARKPAPLWVLYRMQGDNLCHHGLLHGLQGNFCSSTWSTSSPSFSFDLGVCRVVCLTFFSLLSLTAAAQCFLPFFNYIFAEAQPGQLTAQLCPALCPLKSGGTGCV